jgi:[ribosomal protein S5]-alanine N-acetyltransferase
MPELQRLHADHAAAVLAFELANRAYFGAFISDRGHEFFDQFAERHRALLAEQEAGIGAFYVLVAEDGSQSAPLARPTSAVSQAPGISVT